LKLLVCGGRDYNNIVKLNKVLDTYNIDCIIEGGAPGADKLAKLYGTNKGICVLTCEANWNKYGKSAGPLRNKWMLDYGRPDLVVAFPGGSGTASMVALAEAACVRVVIVDED
jgi:YspA, cpYpsA-related SLOG family